MSPEAYARLLSDLGFASTRHVAEFFSVSHSTAQKWAKDGPSPPVEMLLQIMAAMHWKPIDVERIIGGRKS